nr:sigma factor-like helix-turn-helix DNA-binding protein [Actinoplanes rectilineatus]
MGAVLSRCRGSEARETADALGIPEGTVKSRAHYALRTLRRHAEPPRRPHSSPTLCPQGSS